MDAGGDCRYASGCALSSVDRVLASEAKGRAFESRRARQPTRRRPNSLLVYRSPPKWCSLGACTALMCGRCKEAGRNSVPRASGRKAHEEQRYGIARAEHASSIVNSCKPFCRSCYSAARRTPPDAVIRCAPIVDASWSVFSAVRCSSLEHRSCHRRHMCSVCSEWQKQREQRGADDAPTRRELM